MEKILRQSMKNIKIVESSLRLENKLTIQKKPFSELDQQALVEYAPSQRKTEGLLVQSESLKNPDDLEGWEAKPNSFLASCNITIMVGSSLSTAVPADKGSADWIDMRAEYLRSKEHAIKEVHEETHRVLVKFLDTMEMESDPFESMPHDVLYEFGNCVNKVLSSLNKVVAPLLFVRVPRPGVDVLTAPPVTADANYTEELVSRWLIWAVGIVKKALICMRKQATTLGDVLEDVKESLEAEVASAETSAASSPTQGRDHMAAIVYVAGTQPDSDAQPADKTASNTLLAGYSTFYVRRADHRACQELLDRVGEAQDCFNNRGAHQQGSVAHNVLTAKRRVANQTLKLGVHRQSLMPNEFELLRRMPLFRGALNSSDIVYDVASRLKPLLFSSQQSIIRSGTIGMGMYFVNDGTCDVSVAGNQVAKLQFGDFFGEVALTMATQRTATVEASGLVELFEFTRQDLKAVATRHPNLLARLREQGRQRVKRACTARVEVLEGDDGDLIVQDKSSGSKAAAGGSRRGRSSSVEGDLSEGGAEGVGVQCEGGPVDPQCLQKLKFLSKAGANAEKGAAPMTEEEWEALVGQMRRVRVRNDEKVAGETIAEASFYVIEEGRVAVRAGDFELSDLRAGDFFGEVSLMLSSEAVADMYAVGPCTLLRLSRAALCALVDAHPLLYHNLFQVASRRQALAERSLENRRLGIMGPMERLPSAPMRAASSDKQAGAASSDKQAGAASSDKQAGAGAGAGAAEGEPEVVRAFRRSSLPSSHKRPQKPEEEGGDEGGGSRPVATRGGKFSSDLGIFGGGGGRAHAAKASSDLGPGALGGGGSKFESAFEVVGGQGARVEMLDDEDDSAPRRPKESEEA